MYTFTEFFRNFDWSYLMIGLAALLAIMIHEISHGLMAYKLGDTTARDMGRLTFNPIKHIDIFGILMLIVVGFGWAKPVPVDIRYFKNPKLGMAYTALAGPVSNLLTAFLILIIIAALSFVDNTAVIHLTQFLIIFANINIGLGIFNLIPIPPLDGSKILFSLLPDRTYYNILRYERYGTILLVIVLGTGVISPLLASARSVVLHGLWIIASSPFRLIGIALIN